MSKSTKHQEDSGSLLNSTDSFDVNMQQIEQTNRLLHNIESKLVDFFKSSEESGKKHQDYKENYEPYKKSSPNSRVLPKTNSAARDFYDRSESSPLTNTALNQSALLAHLSLFKIYIKKQAGGYISIIENPMKSDTTSYRNTSTSNTTKVPPPVDRKSISSNQAPSFHQNSYSSRTDTLLSDPTKNTGRFDETSLDTKRSEFYSPRGFRETEGGAATRSADVVIDRMNKMDEFYQNKIRIQEEKARAAEAEATDSYET